MGEGTYQVWAITYFTLYCYLILVESNVLCLLNEELKATTWCKHKEPWSTLQHLHASIGNKSALYSRELKPGEEVTWK
ncbi:NADH dehydrogenase 1 beta subcomplex subunit 1 [Takifugu rubripes] [Scomber scombrus]|uniref:NADH dehydrogenase 1 beta subcomplex subunit 1 [Takifugu rubripes] n=1 Tax=Scomber scombrus TaxID=13677 RepID=A0AAV1NUS4_SCOSC